MQTRADHEVVIIGSGVSGIAMAIALGKAGREYIVLEKASDIGGTWRDNRYPGCACDVPSHLYSFSFELNPFWSRAYATSDEIQDYLLYCVEKYDVRKNMRFDSAVQAATYDQARGIWHLTVTSSTGQMRELTATSVILGVGALHDPVLPNIPGLENFGGELMHTASWQPGTTVVDRKVGIIGTGASAVQIIPVLAEDAERLTVFQRTPPWIMPKVDPEYPSSVQSAYEKHPALMKAHRAKIRATNEARVLGFTKQPAILKAGSLIAKQQLHAAIKDPQLRAKLTPSYDMGCKRIILSSNYYPALARPNVEVVTSPIVSVDRTGANTADGEHVDLDFIVMATGFDPAGSYRHLNVHGADGHSLSRDWDEGIESYYGVTLPHYPNLFVLLGPNTLLGHTSVILMIEAQVELITRLLAERDRRGADVVQVRPEVSRGFTKQMHERSAKTVWSTGHCSSWYLDADGTNRTLWPGSVNEYERKARKPEPVDYEFNSVGAS